MELAILVAGFVGSWLLFAGPILQAALELKGQDIARDRIHATKAKIQTPRHVSSWWWLLPPVKFILEQNQARKYQREYITLLDPDDLESLVLFINKARGWLYVAGGALLIAIKETYELSEKMHWPEWLFWPVIVALALGSLLNTINQLSVKKKLAKK